MTITHHGEDNSEDEERRTTERQKASDIVPVRAFRGGIMYRFTVTVNVRRNTLNDRKCNNRFVFILKLKRELYFRPDRYDIPAKQYGGTAYGYSLWCGGRYRESSAEPERASRVREMSMDVRLEDL